MTTDCIHPIKIPFEIPLAPGRTISRFVYAYLVEGKSLVLIDTGVAGSERVIEAAVRDLGRELSDIDVVLLTHAHPDHIGAARTIREGSGAQVWAHRAERAWIEDVDRQKRERPVPGFDGLVGGPVSVDRELEDGEMLNFGEGLTLKALHTPGHSPGSLSFLFEEAGALFCGDVVPEPGAMPIYDDVAALARSLGRLSAIIPLSALYSSWADPLFGDAAAEAVRAGMRYLQQIHETVLQVDRETTGLDPMSLCVRCVERLGLPPFAANPLVARSLVAHRETAPGNDADALFSLPPSL